MNCKFILENSLLRSIMSNSGHGSINDEEMQRSHTSLKSEPKKYDPSLDEENRRAMQSNYIP